MKKPLKVLILALTIAVFAAIFTFTVSAASGLDFKSNGDGTCLVVGIGSCKDTNLVIPSKSPAGDRVTAIGDRAFFNCSDLVSVTIPDGVTVIGRGAFCYCSGLTSVSIPTSVRVIDNDAFEACLALSSVKIPEGVQTIGGSAFRNCTALRSVTIPDTVKEIGENAFYRCLSLASVTIPDGVTTIGFSAFRECASLGSLTIGSGVEIIGDGAFCGCQAIKSLSIPQSVKSIGDFAFRGCQSITSLTIPENVQSIGNGAFADCAGLASISVEAGNEKYKAAGSCLINKGTNTLVLGCKNSVIPTDGSVTAIGDYAFCGASGLRSVSIPNTVAEIGSRAFSGCAGLTSVSIPNNVSAIGLSAFEYCSGLTSITVGSGNTAYKSAGNCLIHKGTKTLNAGCRNSEIPSDGRVTAVAGFAFRGCTGLEEVTVPECVNTIENGAFTDVTGLKSITFLNRTISIDFPLQSSVTVVGYAGSTAQAFAVQNNNPFSAYGESDDPVTPPPEGCGAKDAGKVASGYTPTGTPIRTLADLQNMKETGSYYLANDIDAKGYTTIAAFSGTLDGNGHKIYNLSTPLFGVLNGAAFKNLEVVSAIVLNDSTTNVAVKDPDKNAGIAAGAFAVTANGAGAVFTNVKANVTLSTGSPVTGKAILSGMIGTIAGGDISFTNCEVTGSIFSTDYAAGYSIGAPGYDATVTFTNCTNNSTVSGTTKCSGFLADGRNSTLTFKNCYNAGFMTCSSNSGGYVGYQSGSVEITDSMNVADIMISAAASTGQCCVGGFIGKANSTVTVRNCTNEGDVVCPGNAKNSTGENAMGGIVGAKRNGGDLTIENCQNSGNVYKVGEFAGGIIGGGRNGANVTIKNCTNTGNVTATQKCPAGIVADVYGTFSGNILIENCFNEGIITSLVNEKAAVPGVVAYNGVGSACQIVNSVCRHKVQCDKPTVCTLCGKTILTSDVAETVHVEGCGHTLCRHLNTERVGVIPAKCTENGFTGDLCCKDCGKMLEKGTESRKLGHSVGKDGVCTRCGQLINPVTSSVTTEVVTPGVTTQVVTPTTTAVTTSPITTTPITTAPITTSPVTTAPVTTEVVTSGVTTGVVTSGVTTGVVTPTTSVVTYDVTTEVTTPGVTTQVVTPESDPVDPNANGKNENKALPIVLAIAAALVVGFVLWFIPLSKKKKEKS